MHYGYLRNILEVFFLLVVKRFTWNRKLTLDMRINWRSKQEWFYELNKGNNKITELRTILQRESQNS